MYKLQIENKDGSLYKNINEFDRSGVETNAINDFTLFEYDENIINKVVKFHDWDKPLYTGIARDVKIMEDSQKYKITCFPLRFDLKQWFYQDGSGNEIVYKNANLSTILTDIINQYRNNVTNPLIEIGNIKDLGIWVEYTFKNVSWLEAYQKLFEYLGSSAYIKIDPDGKIYLDNTSETIQLIYKRDVFAIDTDKETSNIVNYVKFDNLAAWPNKITKEYSDQASIDEYDKSVAHIKDSNISSVAAADKKINKYFEKNATPNIVVTQVSSNKDVPLYSKLRIDNWDKKIGDELYVKSKVYNNNTVGASGRSAGWDNSSSYVDLIIGTKSDSRDQLNTWKDIANTVADRDLSGVENPSYIEETKITSTTIESPTISWNNWLFSNTFKVGSSGIEINGWASTPYIQSSNFASWSDGWKIENSWNAEFNNVTVRGDVVASSFSITDWATDASGTNIPDANADVTNANTANDTDNVSWTSASTVESNASDWADAKLVTDAAFNSSNRYKKWLQDWDMEAADSDPSSWVVFDKDGIRGYDSGNKTFEIDTNWNAFFKGDIGASSITASTNITASGEITTTKDDSNGFLNTVIQPSGIKQTLYDSDFPDYKGYTDLSGGWLFLRATNSNETMENSDVPVSLYSKVDSSDWTTSGELIFRQNNSLIASITTVEYSSGSYGLEIEGDFVPAFNSSSLWASSIHWWKWYIDDINSSGTISANWKLKIPVGSNLY